MRPTIQHTAQSHPARKAARAAARANPGLDFSEPAPATSVDKAVAFIEVAAELVAELDREFPRGPTPPEPGPVLTYECQPGSIVDRQIQRTAARVRQLMLDSIERIPFDRDDPSDWNHALADTAALHYESLIALETPAERYVADAVYRAAGWLQHRGVVPTHAWGKTQIRKLVEDFARNLAPLLAEQAELGLEVWD